MKNRFKWFSCGKGLTFQKSNGFLLIEQSLKFLACDYATHIEMAYFRQGIGQPRDSVMLCKSNGRYGNEKYDRKSQTT